MKLQELVKQRDEINKLIIIEKDKLFNSILELPQNPNIKEEGKFLKTIQYKDLINWDIDNSLLNDTKLLIKELKKVSQPKKIINELNYIIDNKKIRIREIKRRFTSTTEGRLIWRTEYTYTEINGEFINNLKTLINRNN